MAIVEKCKKRVFEGWDALDATWHITRDNQHTLCGHAIGSEDQGWFRKGPLGDSSASCQRCIQALKREKSRTYRS